ncbi:DUF6767 domain-containing protein [Nocardioides bruguierae]|uniref:DUF6767 domain-containing protein n=1 Tax=Nocardioides bruguierae TaxID=2945102 RepID=UPI002020F374|nr:DUF6767 domain-containing protein [Nocardioides bruguierae]MCL8026565.1 hypothetical protein [Nocardioides bruguierae]
MAAQEVLLQVGEARCALRPDEACRLCQPGATGPDDCPVAWLVRHDPELAQELAEELRARQCG